MFENERKKTIEKFTEKKRREYYVRGNNKFAAFNQLNKKFTEISLNLYTICLYMKFMKKMRAQRKKE